MVFDSDHHKGLRQYKDSTLTTIKHKQNQERKGHWMRFGKSSDPALNLNHQLGLFMDLAGTHPHTDCLKDLEALRDKQLLSVPQTMKKDVRPSPSTEPALMTKNSARASCRTLSSFLPLEEVRR